MTVMTADAFPVVEELLDNPAAESELLYQYLDRVRKVPVGPSVSFVFENARTLNFRVREVQSLQRVYGVSTVRRMLDWYMSLMPSRGRISASVLVRRPGRRPTPGMNDLASAIAAGRITLQIGELEVAGVLKPCRAGDRIIGPAFWVTFDFDVNARAALSEFETPAYVNVDADGYDWASEPLGFEVRQSLCGDLSRRF